MSSMGLSFTAIMSAAMPGLVGAVLRKGGPLAALRKDITYSSESTGHEICDGSVTVKLFNMTTREIGPLLLKRGVWLKGTELREIFDRCADILSNSCRQAFYNDTPISIASLMEKIKARTASYCKLALISIPHVQLISAVRRFTTQPGYPPPTGGKTPNRLPSFKIDFRSAWTPSTKMSLTRSPGILSCRKSASTVVPSVTARVQSSFFTCAGK